MSQLGILEAGSRHDLARRFVARCAGRRANSTTSRGRLRLRPFIRDVSRYDGPGVRVVLFVSGCLLRCSYCHNPDTWHLKDGTYVSAQQVLDRLAGFAPALRAMDGGLTISGGEPMVQLAFTRRIFAGAKRWACTRRSKPRAFSATAPTRLPVRPRSRSARHQELGPRDLSQGHRPRAGADPALRRAARRDRQAGLGAVHAGAGPDRRSRQRRGHRPIRRADEECRVGRGSAVPPAWRVQMEGDEPRLQARRHADADARSREPGDRTIPRGGLPRTLTRGP